MYPAFSSDFYPDPDIWNIGPSERWSALADCAAANRRLAYKDSWNFITGALLFFRIFEWPIWIVAARYQCRCRSFNCRIINIFKSKPIEILQRIWRRKYPNIVVDFIDTVVGKWFVIRTKIWILILRQEYSFKKIKQIVFISIVLLVLRLSYKC